ncbi:hypothetical protein OXYTRIMIC_645 [Oxytricha trifallax]|uniref:Uncharacterized protein n=1 Tax=Oxytricha trifallax TaxID=1172189 RepID=A0A073HZI1_9SPIT|nr:hypothetical protein OXYTRIMIC_645 [Oxytricha trifallax]
MTTRKTITSINITWLPNFSEITKGKLVAVYPGVCIGLPTEEPDLNQVACVTRHPPQCYYSKFGGPLILRRLKTVARSWG